MHQLLGHYTVYAFTMKQVNCLMLFTTLLKIENLSKCICIIMYVRSDKEIPKQVKVEGKRQSVTVAYLLLFLMHRFWILF